MIRSGVTVNAFVGAFGAPFAALGAGPTTTLPFHLKRVLLFQLGLPFFRFLVKTFPYPFFLQERVTNHSVPIN